MTAIPKPVKSKKIGIQGPQLTEYDFQEVGEKIGESMELQAEVEITAFSHKRYETYVGIVQVANAQKGILSLDIGGIECVQININSIVSVK